MSQQINLFSPIFLRQKKHFSAIPMVQGLALVLLAMLGLYAYAHYQISLLANQSQELAKRVVATQGKLEKSGSGISAAQKTSNVLEEIKIAEAELKRRQELISGLGGGQMGNAEGYSVFMRAMARQNINGLWLTGFSVNEAGNEMKISGRTLNAELVPVFIRKLNQEAFMRGRSFEYLQIRSGQSVSIETTKDAQTTVEPASPTSGNGLMGLLTKILPSQPTPAKTNDLTIGDILKGQAVPEKPKAITASPASPQRAYLEFDLFTRNPEDVIGGKAK